MVESDLENVRGKLAGLLGTLLADEDVAQVLDDVVRGGGGIYIEFDDQVRYRLIRREGKFMLTKDASRGRLSTVPPRR